jgi:predicted ferric reductase
MTNTPAGLSEAARLPAIKHSPMSFKSLMIIYAIVVLTPWALSFIEGLEVRGWYEELVTLLSIAGMSVMFCQFILLNGRVDSVSSRIGVDNAMKIHDKSGQYLAFLFLLHPFLIEVPRFLVAPSFALENLWVLFTSPEAATGVYAWSMLIVFSLMAIFKNKIGLSYEAWRYTHSFGFVAVIILATHHAVTVGRHGRYNIWFDVFWISLCAVAVGVVLYIFLIRPRITASKPFKVVDCHKGSADDWYLTIEKDGDFFFDFDAGQFTWISTSNSTYHRNEHPFSIASNPAALPQLNYVIRDLGDYTRQLGKLKPGQRVWVDGPHGVFTLNARNAKGIALIAGGAGIGPIIGILRELQHSASKLPIRLIYGNRNIDQMMFLDELEAMRSSLDFDFTLVLNDPPENFSGHKGFIDVEVLGSLINTPNFDCWDYYICGSELMVKAVEQNLKLLNIPQKRILYEQLGF